MSSSCTLDRIARGGVARVLDIEGEPDAIARRLDDLGLRTAKASTWWWTAVFWATNPERGQEEFRMTAPTVFELHGYQLCLRRSESARVRVEPKPERLSEP